MFYLFIMSSYTKYKYNRTQNTGKVRKEIKNNSRDVRKAEIRFGFGF